MIKNGYIGKFLGFFGGNSAKVEPEKEVRTAFKTQVVDINKDLNLTPEEIQLADRFDRLGRSCRRVIERQHPRNWEMLSTLVDEHEDPHHNLNHR